MTERSRPSRDARTPDLDRVVVFGNLLAQARQSVEVLVLEEEHGVWVAYRRLDESLRVVGRGRLDHLQARGVHKKRLGVQAVKRHGVYAGAARAAEDRGYTSAKAEATLGRVLRHH